MTGHATSVMVKLQPEFVKVLEMVELGFHKRFDNLRRDNQAEDTQRSFDHF